MDIIIGGPNHPHHSHSHRRGPLPFLQKVVLSLSYTYIQLPRKANLPTRRGRVHNMDDEPTAKKQLAAADNTFPTNSEANGADKHSPMQQTDGQNGRIMYSFISH